jgi:hypothetical protein
VTRIASRKGAGYQARIRRPSALVGGCDGKKPKLSKALVKTAAPPRQPASPKLRITIETPAILMGAGRSAHLVSAVNGGVA